MKAAKGAHPDSECAQNVLEVCLGADVVLHLTEWKRFREIDPAKL
jgi:UDPglucose 6-dehydrogenase